MTRTDMQTEVGRLLAKRQELSRLGLELPPDQLMLLKRLLYRLGWTKAVPMSRVSEKPRRFTRTYSHDNFVRKIAENPTDATASLVYADWLDENGMPTFASIIRQHVARHKNQQGPHVMIGEAPKQEPYAPVVSAEMAGHQNLVFISQVSPEHKNRDGHPYGHYYSQVVTGDEPTNDLLDKLEAEGVNYRQVDRYPVTRRKKMSRRPRRLARLTLGPGQEFGQPFGGNEAMRSHDIHDESGRNVGVAVVQRREGGKHLHVHYVGDGQTDLGTNENQFGREGMRHVFTHLATLYPGADTVGGNRMSGFRKGGSESDREVRFNLNRFRNRPQGPQPDGAEPNVERLSRKRVRVVGPKRYMTGPQDLLTELQKPEYGSHMAGLDDPLGGLRGVAADHMDEQGRHDEAKLLRTPGAHVEIRPDGTVHRSFMQRQEINYQGRHHRTREQFVKPSFSDGSDEADHHTMSYHFAVPHQDGTGHWAIMDAEGLGVEDLNRLHPNWREYPRTDDLIHFTAEHHPMTPAELAYMHHHATTPEFRREDEGHTPGGPITGPQHLSRPSFLSKKVVRMAKSRPGTWWMHADGKLEPVDDHYLWLTRHGYPKGEDGFAEAFRRGLRRVLRFGDSVMVESGGHPITDGQLSALKDLTVESGSQSLIHMTGNRERTLWDRSDKLSRLSQRVVRYETFEKRNKTAKNKAESARRPHVKRGQHVCRSCWEHYHAVPRARKCPECGGDVYTVTRSSRVGPRRYALSDLPHLMRSSTLKSTHHPSGFNQYEHDTAAGGALADALDESGKPHAPFFRNLVSRDVVQQEDPSKGQVEHRTGNYRHLLNDPHPLNHVAYDNEGTAWRFTPARHDDGHTAVFVQRSLRRAKPGTNGMGLQNATRVLTHTAVMHAPDLRQWAAHPDHNPTMRDLLNRMAEHLEGQHPEQMSRRPRRYADGQAWVDAVRANLASKASDRKAGNKARERGTQGTRPPEQLAQKLVGLLRRNGHMNRRQILLSGNFTKEALDAAHKHAVENGLITVSTVLNRPEKGAGGNRAGTWYDLPKQDGEGPVERMGRVRRYAKVPRSEEGILSPEQLLIAQRAHQENDLTAWGALGDHLADNGYPNTGALLARVGSGHPAATYMAGAGGLANPHTSRVPGWFHYRMLRDGSDLLHHLYLTTEQGDTHIFTHRVRPHEREQMSRAGLPKRYAMTNQSNFIDALRRIRSSNQKAVHQVAKLAAQKLGLTDTKIVSALHDTPHGSVPGVAQAVYGNVPPEHLNALGAWIGLTSNLPGYAVFHARPSGPDALYRVRVHGSGMDARARLDRAGITNRVLVPHHAGFDVMVPDIGTRMGHLVQAFADAHGSKVEMSPGHLSVVGSADQAKAREMFRNKVVAQEQGA